MIGVVANLLRAAVTGQDDLNNDILGYTVIPVSGCAFVPGQTEEATQGGDQVTSDAELYWPVGTVISPLDQAEYPPGSGRIYAILGDPSNWTSPFSGNTAPERTRLRIVTGATAHAVVSGTGA